MAGNQTLGIDLSEWRKSLWAPQFDKLHKGGVRFCFTRATRGNAYRDPTARRYVRLSFQQGWVTGLYHFMDTSPVEAQVENFVQSVREVERWEMLKVDALVLDIEIPGLKGIDVAYWVSEVRRVFPGRKVGLYSRMGYLNGRDWGSKVVNLFDYTWWALWEGSRWLNSWDKDNPVFGSTVIQQFGTLKYRWNDKTVGIDGNVYVGSPLQLFKLVH